MAESRERVRGALNALGLALPPKRITVNLAPADLAKDGSHFDLPIALGLLGLLQSHVRFAEVRARVVHVGVQARAKEHLIQIVMMANVAVTGGHVVPGNKHERKRPAEPRPTGLTLEVRAQNDEQIVKGALDDVPLACQVGLAQVELGISQNACQRAAPVQAHGGERSAGAELSARTIGVDDGQRSVGEKPIEELRFHNVMPLRGGRFFASHTLPYS